MSKNRPTLTLNRPVVNVVTPESTMPPQIQRPEGDIVDRIFDLLPDFLPVNASLDEAKAAVRAEWGGTLTYVQQESPADRSERRAELVRQVNEQFDGRNAREIARKLGIGVTTVYRMIKRR